MSEEEPISFIDGEVDEGSINPTLKRSGPSIKVNVPGEDGQSIPGTKVTLTCGQPPRSVKGTDDGFGTFEFQDAIPTEGTEECKIIVEAPG